MSKVIQVTEINGNNYIPKFLELPDYLWDQIKLLSKECNPSEGDKITITKKPDGTYEAIINKPIG